MLIVNDNKAKMFLLDNMDFINLICEILVRLYSETHLFNIACKTLYTNSRAALLLVIRNVRTSSTVHQFITHMFTIIILPSTGKAKQFHYRPG